MQDIEFHAYIKSVAAHMEGWEYRARENVHTGTVELRMAPRVHHSATGAEIYFTRDDHRKKFSANAEWGREIDGRRTHLSDDFKASAGFSQGRDPAQVARTVLAKVADTAIKAHAELNKRAGAAADARATMESTIKVLNASRLLSSPLAQPSGIGQGDPYFYAKSGAGGRVESDGGVRFERLSVDAQTAVRILKILAERGE